jgi:hypothetical protein
MAKKAKSMPKVDFGAVDVARSGTLEISMTKTTLEAGLS